MNIGNNIKNKIVSSLSKLHVSLSQDGPIDDINQKSRSKIFQLTNATLRNMLNPTLWM